MMTLPESIATLNTLPTISLAELQAQAAYLTRKDRKYLVPASDVESFVASLDSASQVLEIDDRRSFCYQTPYFDVDHFASYFSALRRRPNRFKVRTRLYVDSGLCQFEVKIRNGRGQTVKHRLAHDSSHLNELTDVERAWLDSFPQVKDYAVTLRHRITTHYRRSTLMLPGGAGRVTIDRDLAFTLPSGQHLDIPAMAIIETKGPGKPTTADHVLWRQKHRPLSISKFTIGLCLLVPELPANRWHRLRKHLSTVAVSSQLLVPGISLHFESTMAR